MPDRPRRGLYPADDSGGAVALDDVSETETVGDLVDLDSLARGLPPGWGVVADVAPFDDEPLVEVLRLRRSPADPELLLKPVDTTSPDGPIVCYERRPDGRRNRIATPDTLESAVRAATNWAHQRTA